MRTAIAALLLALPLGAQAATDARAFVPKDYRCECFVDFVALRECGLWDHMERSMVVQLMDSLQAQIGVRIGDLDRLRAFPETPSDEPERDGRRGGGVVVFEGNGNVGLPMADEERSLRLDKLGAFDVLVEDHSWTAEDPDLWVSPKAGLLVYGTRHLIAPILEGKAGPGVPPPEFLSLTSGRGNLAFVVMEMTAAMLRDVPEEMAGMNPAGDEDPLRHLLVRVRQVGEGDEATFELQGTLRYARGAKAPELAAKWLREGLQQLEKHQQLGALKRFWRKVEVKVDRQDVTARLDLGNARKAAGEIGNLLAPLMVMGTRLEAVGGAVLEDVTLEPVAVPPPPPPPPPPEPVPPKPKGEKPGGGGGNGG
jgi:hypothetical protein